jgi:hypothetical protein
MSSMSKPVVEFVSLKDCSDFFAGKGVPARGLSSCSSIFEGFDFDLLQGCSDHSLFQSNDPMRMTSWLSTCDDVTAAAAASESAPSSVVRKVEEEAVAVAVDATEFNPLFTMLSTFAFKSDIFTTEFCASLFTAFPLILNQIKHRAKFNDVSIDIVHQIAENVTGNNISRSDVHHEERLCFEMAFLDLYRNFAGPSVFINDQEAFLTKYPEFRGDGLIDASEMAVLMKFRNNMALAMTVIKATGHKNHLMDLVTRYTEGKGVAYIAGTGQSKKTSRRVLIFRREGNVPLITKASKGEKSKKTAPCGTSNSRVNVSSSTTDELRRANHRTYLQAVSNKRENDLTTRRYAAPAVVDSLSVATTVDSLFVATTSSASSTSASAVVYFSPASVESDYSDMVKVEEEELVPTVPLNENFMEVQRAVSDDFLEFLNVFRCASA